MPVVTAARYKNEPGNLCLPRLVFVVGIIRCGTHLPSGPASYRTRGQVLAQAQAPLQAADWWFGLYSGINWVTDEETNEAIGIIEPNLVQCTFRAYPMETPGEILQCLGMVYLPLIQSSAPAATGQ